MYLTNEIKNKYNVTDPEHDGSCGNMGRCCFPGVVLSKIKTLTDTRLSLRIRQEKTID